MGKWVCEKRAKTGRDDENPQFSGRGGGCGCLGCAEWRGMKAENGTREGGRKGKRGQINVYKITPITTDNKYKESFFLLEKDKGNFK